MIAALLLAAATPQTAIEAERAFAADAQTSGQWTAFRKWAADASTMFVPEPILAQAWLKDRKDPPKSVNWEPVQVWESCDGSVAVTTGYWHRPDNSVGWFTTVWKRQADGGWRWVLDHGDALGPNTLGHRRFENHALDCRRKLKKPKWSGKLGRLLSLAPLPRPGGGGESIDGTLRYNWTMDHELGSGSGGWSHEVTIELWGGKEWSKVLTEWVAAKQ